MALTQSIAAFEVLLLSRSFFIIYVNSNPLSFLEMIVFAKDLHGRSMSILYAFLSPNLILSGAVTDL